MSEIICTVIGFALGAICGALRMVLIIESETGDVQDASPIADEGGKDSDSPTKTKE